MTWRSWARISTRRVVDHLRGAAARPPTLHITSGVQETDGVAFTGDYREYFARLGRGIGDVMDDSQTRAKTGRLAKTVRVLQEWRGPPGRTTRHRHGTSRWRLFRCHHRDEYPAVLGDAELMLATANVAGMLAPGGVFLHNESRPLLAEVATKLGMPFAQSRHMHSLGARCSRASW